MQNRFREFTLLTSNVVRTINKIKNFEMKKYGLKGTQVSCLFYLYGSDGDMTAKDICSLCQEDKAAISRALKDLENKGFIVCENDSNKKKYNTLLTLTESGKKVAKQILNTIERILKYDKNFISEQELSEFYQTFNKIYENLKHVSENYGGEDD